MNDLEVLQQAGTFKTWFQKAIATMFIGIILSMLAIGFFVQKSNADRHNEMLKTEESRQADVQTGRENGYKNRAVLCQAVYNNPVNRPISSLCRDPEVVKYLDPGTAVTTQ